MNAHRRLVFGFVTSLAVASAPVHAQGATIEMHWVGLFGPYSPHPLPDDPLPEVTLFPMGELPRPLTRTDRIPAKMGTRFGLLFTLRGTKSGFVRVTQVVHYPAPGLVIGPGEPPVATHEDRMLCITEKPCYVGYRFQDQREILPGEWRMELKVDGVTIHESTFTVAPEPELATNFR